jgi:hypothetical protein
MKPGEIDLAIEWAAAEGWNPGLHDGPVFQATDPRGFLIGLLDGQPIASISVVAYDDAFGFLGFYIVKPEFRGRGYGLEIWNRGMMYLEARNVGLDGVPAQQANYQKSGFSLAHRNVRYEGVATATDNEPGNVVAIGTDDVREVTRLDREVFPAPRQDFLRRWLGLADSHALAARRDGTLEGYAVIRASRSGYKIGPLVANNECGAENLLHGLLSRVPAGSAVFIDVPESNPAATRIAENAAMKPVSEAARMYNRGQPDVRTDKLFGVTSLELG